MNAVRACLLYLETLPVSLYRLKDFLVIVYLILHRLSSKNAEEAYFLRFFGNV